MLWKKLQGSKGQGGQNKGRASDRKTYTTDRLPAAFCIKSESGGVSFDTDSFSYYWTWNSGEREFERVYYSGGSDAIRIGRNDGKTLLIPYSERTQVVKFQSSNSPAKNGYEIIAGGGYTSLVKTHGGASCEVSIQGGTPENAEIKVKYTHGAITGAYDIVTLKVVRIPKEFIKDCTDIPISIVIMEDSSFIRSEPTKTTGGKYVRVNGQLGISSDTSTKYSDNAYTLVKKDILDKTPEEYGIRRGDQHRHPAKDKKTADCQQ